MIYVTVRRNGTAGATKTCKDFMHARLAFRVRAGRTTLASRSASNGGNAVLKQDVYDETTCGLLGKSLFLSSLLFPLLLFSLGRKSVALFWAFHYYY